MKKFVLTVLVLTLSASPALAQVGAVGFFADPQGNECNITVPILTAFAVYVVHKSPTGATGSQWRMVAPTSPSFFFNGGGPGTAGNILAIGEPVNGIALAYGACLVGNSHIYTLNFFAVSAVPDCSPMTIAASLQGGGVTEVLSVDCALLEYAVVPGEARLNANASCDCDVPTQESTWGKVKSLYR
jgi:hypothetical protein